MNSLRARVIASFYGVGVSGASRGPIDLSQTTEFEYGTAANRGDFVWSSSATIVASATTTLDFGGAALDDAFGSTIDAASIKAICIVNTGTVAITLGGTNRGVAAISLAPSGSYLVTTPAATGYTRSGGADAGTITLTNESASVAAAYSIAVLGVQT